MYRVDFAVKGKGRFPTDMLRYDTCFPTGSQDVAAIDPDERHERIIHLCAFKTTAVDARRALTPRRWESFGWDVIEQSVTKV